MSERMPQSVRNVEQAAMGRPNGGTDRRPNAAAPPLPSERKLTERQAPKLIQFDAPGVVVTGILRGCEKIKIQDSETQQQKSAIQYSIYNEIDRQEYKILGTYDINQKLRWPDDRGRWVEIAYVGDNPKFSRNGKSLREFSVRVDEGAAPAKFADGTEITDEDIPF